jgi:hypothetical protein
MDRLSLQGTHASRWLHSTQARIAEKKASLMFERSRAWTASPYWNPGVVDAAVEHLLGYR